MRYLFLSLIAVINCQAKVDTAPVETTFIDPPYFAVNKSMGASVPFISNFTTIGYDPSVDQKNIPSPSESDLKIFQDALKKSEEGKSKDALQILKEHNTNKESSFLNYQIALRELEAGNANSSLIWAKSAIEKFPNYFYAYRLIGMVYLANQNYLNANKAFEKALKLEGNHYNTQALYVFSFILSGDYKSAKKLRSKMTKEDEYTEWWIVDRWLDFKLGNLKKGDIQEDRLVNLKPDELPQDIRIMYLEMSGTNR